LALSPNFTAKNAKEAKKEKEGKEEKEGNDSSLRLCVEKLMK